MLEDTDYFMEQNQITHPELVRALAKPGQKIIEGLTSQSAHNLHMVVGIIGEAGELLDAVKKQAIYCKPLDMENVVEELGDLEFYLQGLRSSLGITREQTLQGNIAKLSKRYASLTYSDQAAQERADKA
jgi:NTP pyrophosphatase (non-canonical NTP hydrolase)